MHKFWIFVVALALPAAAAGTGSSRLEGAEPASPAPGGAIIYFLGHCGWAVRTASHFLIFDYQEKRDGRQAKVRPGRPSLAEGWIDPEEINGLKVRVFVSHSHGDHFDPVILNWERFIPDIAYFFGWKAGEEPAHAYLGGPRAEWKKGGMAIATINSHHSGVPEVAWLVTVDGLVIYHNGDCQPEDAAAEYDFLKTRAEGIDIAFVPPDHEAKWKYSAQNRCLFRKFAPAAVFPMHATSGDPMYLEFRRGFAAEFPGLQFLVPMKMGQRFVYEKGRVQE